MKSLTDDNGKFATREFNLSVVIAGDPMLMCTLASLSQRTNNSIAAEVLSLGWIF